MLALKVVFFSKMFKVEAEFRISKKSQKVFFVSEINASENVAIKGLCKEENTCGRESMG